MAGISGSRGKGATEGAAATGAADLPPGHRGGGRIGRQRLIVFCVWTLIVAASFGWNGHQTQQQVLALAAAEAKTNLSRDLAFRRWATDHGGIYVRVDDKTRPNPYLANMPERDVALPDGGLLTLYNPATALREIMEQYSELYGVKARITGLKVINPIDRPDPWEEKALHEIERSRQDFVEVSDIGGKPYLRMLQPMLMEEGCLKCHAWTGIPVGGIRGGTAVAVPLEPYLQLRASSLRDIGLTHGGLWLIGVGVIGFVAQRARRHAAAAEQAERQLRKISQAVEQSAHGVLITDAAGMIEYLNPKLTQINGYTLEELQGRTPSVLKSGETDPAVYREMWQALTAGKEWRGEFKNRRKDGGIYWCMESISPVKDAAGAVTHFIAVIEDISERKAAEATIRRLAFYDPLTDLPNRRLLREHLEQAIAWSRRAGGMVALLYLDLDRFKYVNDTLGHPVGDGLLLEVGTRLARCVRDNDLVARLGGDEFAVVVGNMRHIEDGGAVAEKILAAFDAPFRVDGHELYVSGSIGISLYPNDTREIDELIRNADIAMYQAKDKGKGNFQYYDAAVNALTVERLDLEHGLRGAIEGGELTLEYQPKLDLKSGRIFAAEALVRWNHPVRGRVPPGKFIPLAEETQLIVALGEWVLRRACTEAGSWRHHDDIGISVNLSPVQFRRKGLLECIGRVLAETGFAPWRLELEITESALMDNPEEAVKTLLGLRALGITVSIDDFGTGYSSLGHLKRFPVSVLKIDRSFVRDINIDPDDKAIAQAVIALAQSLRLASIAEGVETEEQLLTLQALGCDAIQGYYIGRPMPPAELLRLIAGRNEPPVAGLA